MTIRQLFFDDDGRTPNSALPVLIHRDIDDGPDRAQSLETRFSRHGWPAQWRGGVFDYHHYHSTAHEALGVASGHATLILGGEQGESFTITMGDVLILPAGTGHCCISASDEFCLVGAYPVDQADWDLCRPGTTDIHAARRRIAALPLPAQDPVVGGHQGLTLLWFGAG